MLKKFLAVMATLGILSTSAMALTVIPGTGTGTLTDYIDNVVVSPDPFNPNNQATATIGFNIAGPADVVIYVIDSSNNTVATLANYEPVTTAGYVSDYWTGRVSNNPSGALLPNGTYTAFAFAYETGNHSVILDYDYEEVLLDSQAVQGSAPAISDLLASPSSFSALDSQGSFITFDVSEEANLVVEIRDGSTTVKTYSDYDGDNYPNNAYHSIEWDGRDNNGNIVANGTYSVYVNATDNDGTNTATTSVELLTSGSVSDAPIISDLQVSPNSFSALDAENTYITFDVNEDANLVVEVRYGSTVVKTYSAYNGDNHQSTAYHSIEWDGRDDNGNIMASGAYTVYVSATDNDGTNTATTSVEVLTSGSSDGIIEDLELNPTTNWDPTEEELEIDFDLTEDVDDLEIYAEKDGEVIEIEDEYNVDDGNYEAFWNGEDEDGDYVEGGIWRIYVEADGDVVSRTVEVEYERPEITTLFLTKDEFDPTEDEFTNLVFEVDATALVTVEVYDGSKRIATLMDEEEVRKNRYYAVLWDGTDKDDDEVDEGDYRFKVTAENPTDDDIYDVETIDVDVDEDDVSSSKSNATNDYTDPVIFDEDSHNSIEISYCIDEDAEVYLAVYDGTYTSGTPEIELLDYVDQSAGCHTVEWDGQDDDGKDLDEGINSYKLITKIGSYKDTEIGKFVVGSAGDIDDDDDDDNDPFYDSACYNYYWDLSYLDDDNELCRAIAWGTEFGIWDGYPDGTFKPYDVINRAEVLKVALETFEVNLFPLSGTNEGFSDVSPHAWYMPYVRTAKFYGMFHGYPDGTARLSDQINRVELLKILLEASAKFTSYEFSDALAAQIYDDIDSNGSDWYYAYASTAYRYDLYDVVDNNLYPGNLAERGEVALLLYRMYKAGLLND